MQIKINDKILSIPPYISTSWTHIAALHMKGSLLAITLTDGDTINISGLPTETIEIIFNYHAAYLEKENFNMNAASLPRQPKNDLFNGLFDQTGESGVKLVLGSIDGLGAAMQHNPTQADAPDLPAELLQKISAITKLIVPLDESFSPKAEPFCNCFHCQIARVINPQPAVAAINEEAVDHEEVKDEDLQFQQWAIIQTGDRLFSVTNRLDTHEKYNVYLGNPVGCTCGKQGCAHIVAVLKS
jgi:hypothetical protein